MSAAQVDNQLLGSTQPVMVCVTSSSQGGASDSGPALQVNAVKVPSRLMLTKLFKVSRPGRPGTRWGSNGGLCLQHLMVTARRFTVVVEEKLLLKLLRFCGYGPTEAGGSEELLTAGGRLRN